MKRLVEVGRIMFLFFAAVILVNMGEGEKKVSVGLEPTYAALEEGEGSYRGMVYDEKTTSQLRDLSFFGHTSVGGIRKEGDDSVNRLELSKLKEIRIISGSRDSKRYSDKEFVLAQVIMINGAEVNDLLIPKHVVICGIEQNTHMEKAWFLGKINKVVISGEALAKGVVEKKEVVAERKQTTQQVFVPEKLEEDKEAKGVIGSFIGVIDSVIDLFKATINKIMNWLGW